MSRLWTPERGKLGLPDVWLPRRFREEQQGRPVRRPSRAQIRRFLHTPKVRRDGTRYTQQPLWMREMTTSGRRRANRKRREAARHTRRTLQ